MSRNNMTDEERTKVREAAKILEKYGMGIVEFSGDPEIKKAADKCEEQDWQGDCEGCACSVCLAQAILAI